jgi:hypothetical protein
MIKPAVRKRRRLFHYALEIIAMGGLDPPIQEITTTTQRLDGRVWPGHGGGISY